MKYETFEVTTPEPEAFDQDGNELFPYRPSMAS